MLGYGDTFLGLEMLDKPSNMASQLNFPGWQIMMGLEWFLNIRMKYRNIVNSDQYVLLLLI